MIATTCYKFEVLRRSPSRRGLLLRTFILALIWFVLSPPARALLPPPAPDGGYNGGNTAEGDGALFSLTVGEDNMASGYLALSSNTTGSFNTADGAHALQSSTTGNNNTANGSLALFNNIRGQDNTAVGFQALLSNTDARFMPRP